MSTESAKGLTVLIKIAIILSVLGGEKMEKVGYDIQRIITSFPEDKKEAFTMCLMSLKGTVEWLKLTVGEKKLTTVMFSPDMNALAILLSRGAPVEAVLEEVKVISSELNYKKALKNSEKILDLFNKIKQAESDILAKCQDVDTLIWRNDKSIETLFNLYRDSKLHYEAFSIVCDELWSKLSFEGIFLEYWQTNYEEFEQLMKQKYGDKDSGKKKYVKTKNSLVVFMKHGLPVKLYCGKSKNGIFNNFCGALELAMDFDHEFYLEVVQHIKFMTEFYDEKLHDGALALVAGIQEFYSDQNEKTISKILVQYVNEINVPYDDFMKMLTAKTKEPDGEDLIAILPLFKSLYNPTHSNDKFRKNFFGESYIVEMYTPRANNIKEKINGVLITEEDYNYVLGVLAARGIPAIKRVVAFAVRKHVLDRIISEETKQLTTETLDDFLDYLTLDEELKPDKQKVI